VSGRVAVRDGLWREDRDGTLTLVCGHCHECSKHHFPAMGNCPHCGAAGPAETHLGPAATLWAWTTVAVAPPGYEGPLPYDFGIVELAEGLRVVTVLEDCGPDSGVHFGDPMEMVLHDLHRDGDGRTVVTWAFRPR